MKKSGRRRLVKEDVRVLFLWKPSNFFRQGGDLESCGDLSWEDLLNKIEELSDLESEAWVVVLECDVTDVLVSLSSVVNEFCDGFSCCSDWDSMEPLLIPVQKRLRCREEE